MPRKSQSRSGFGHWDRPESKKPTTRGDSTTQSEQGAPILGSAPRSPQPRRVDPADEATRRSLETVAQQRSVRDRLFEPPIAGGHQPDKEPTRAALESLAAIRKAREAAGLLDQEEQVWERVVRAAGPIINAQLAAGQPPAQPRPAPRRQAPPSR